MRSRKFTLGGVVMALGLAPALSADSAGTEQDGLQPARRAWRM